MGSGCIGRFHSSFTSQQPLRNCSIERVVPITEKNAARSKRALYRIADPYLGFWHTIVAPQLRRGTIGLADPAEIWERMVEPRLDDYMGEVFEQICREWVTETKTPFAPVRVGGWWDSKSQNEVDVAAVDADDRLVVGECKWGVVTGEHLEKLRERAQLVGRELGRVTEMKLALFTGRGECDDIVQGAVEAGEVMLYGPEDLLPV